jgi:hypothetical protein
MGNETIKTENKQAIIDDFDSEETYIVRYDPKYSSRLLARLAVLNEATVDSRLAPARP